jgi:hypothetical protein
MNRNTYFRFSISLVLTAALLFTLQDRSVIHAQGPVPSISEIGPDVMTMWDFYNSLGATREKRTRLLQSFACGQILPSGCSGAMISPHIFMTAAHCGGPGHIGSVRFFRIDEDSSTPGSSAQKYSESYTALTFPWTTFGPNTGGGDTQLWWVEDGSDGVPPGIKYGYLDLEPTAVSVGQSAYSFWVNPVGNFNGSPLDDTLLYSEGNATNRFVDEGFRGPTTDYDIYAAGGASGSPVIGANSHGIIGITSCVASSGESKFRCASDADHFLRMFDADRSITNGSRNLVLDAIEYDWLMTKPLRNFMALGFDTPLQRSQWQKAVVESGEVGGGEIINESGRWRGRITGNSTGTTDGFWHRTARFAPNATYRVMIRLLPRTSATQAGYIIFKSDAGKNLRALKFEPAGEQVLTERITLGNFSDYRLFLSGSSLDVLDIFDVTIVREDGAFGFETAEGRNAWGYIGNSYVTSWGISGPTDFSGVVDVRPGLILTNLSNRLIALKPNETYEVSFTAKHVSGPLSNKGVAGITTSGLSGVARSEWTFPSASAQVTHTFTFINDASHTNGIIFFATDVLKYMVDNIRIRKL